MVQMVGGFSDEKPADAETQEIFGTDAVKAAISASTGAAVSDVVVQG
jgi:hypothetical protein